MAITFITGNAGKFQEAKTIIPNLEQRDLDLPEIQELDPQKVIAAKLVEALNHVDECVVEDTSLAFDGLNGLPGPLIKWFLKAMGLEGLVSLVEQGSNYHALAITWIGYQKRGQDPVFFAGTLRGRIVKPRGNNGFGWDPIFEVEGSQLTFAEMTQEEKNACSMRKHAFEQLRAHLMGSKDVKLDLI